MTYGIHRVERTLIYYDIKIYEIKAIRFISDNRGGNRLSRSHHDTEIEHICVAFIALKNCGVLKIIFLRLYSSVD